MWLETEFLGCNEFRLGSDKFTSRFPFYSDPFWHLSYISFSIVRAPDFRTKIPVFRSERCPACNTAGCNYPSFFLSGKEGLKLTSWHLCNWYVIVHDVRRIHRACNFNLYDAYFRALRKRNNTGKLCVT